jgi:pyruvate/2-oxoglutarate dehydrogenase complex dihydrolipoamide dehydrogenase (E3) component
MSQPERFEILILGSGKSGKLLAWHMAQSGRRTAVIERQWIGGSCPNIACLPSKNEIWSARVAHLARLGAQFGVATGRVTTDMATVRQRKRNMCVSTTAGRGSWQAIAFSLTLERTRQFRTFPVWSLRSRLPTSGLSNSITYRPT